MKKKPFRREVKPFIWKFSGNGMLPRPIIIRCVRPAYKRRFRIKKILRRWGY